MGFVIALRLDKFHKALVERRRSRPFPCAPLHHHAGARLQHRTADRHTIVGEDLRRAPA